MRPDVEADDIDQAVTGAFRQADERPGERVHFFDRVVVLEGDFVDSRAVERADSIRDEVRRVLAEHDAFAEANVAISGDGA